MRVLYFISPFAIFALAIPLRTAAESEVSIFRVAATYLETGADPLVVKFLQRLPDGLARPDPVLAGRRFQKKGARFLRCSALPSKLFSPTLLSYDSP